jgi:hypothetical protein
MSYVPIAAVLVRQAVEQVGYDERPARRRRPLHRVAVTFFRGKVTNVKARSILSTGREA